MTQNKIKISIIIPVYNAEDFLVKCLSSATRQTYSNIEIIIVNDGSTDKSGEIIKKFESSDSRIKYFEKENGGIGSAYAIAFKHFQGDYVTFLDSDDYLELDACEKLLDLAVKNNADMVHFRKRIIDVNGEEINKHSHKAYVGYAKSNEEVISIYLEHLRHPSLANFYRSDILKEVTLFDQNVGIDEMLTPQLLLKIKSAVFTDVFFYNAFFRPDSVSKSVYSNKKILELHKVYTFLLDFLEKKNIHLYCHIFEKYEKILYSYSKKCVLSTDKKLKSLSYKECKIWMKKSKNCNRKNPIPYNKFLILKTLLFFSKRF